MSENFLHECHSHIFGSYHIELKQTPVPLNQTETSSDLLLLLSRFSRIQLCAALWTAAHQASLSMGFSRQEFWRGFWNRPIPERIALLQRIFPTQGSNLHLMSLVMADRFFATSATWEASALT